MKSYTVFYTVLLFMWLITFQNQSFASGEHGAHGKDPHGHQSNQHKSDAHDSQGHESDAHEHGSDEHDSHEQAVNISESIAQKSKLQTSVVTAGIVGEQLQVYGRVVNDTSQTNHVRARFKGIISAVNVQIGDQVKQGDILAYVESNESLKTYPIKAMMSGVVIERHANQGELAQEQVLFTLADFDQVWAELQIFPGQLAQIKSGQKVLLSFLGVSIDSTIEHIIPSLAEKPYAVARVKIDNESGNWSPGIMVSGLVTINQFEAKMIVKQQAIQTIENQAVVFVKDYDTYIAQAVELGRSDGHFTEIISGLQLGDEYVSDNSYLIKADIEKSAAAHDH